MNKKIKVFLIAVLVMIVLAVGLNTRNIVANNSGMVPRSDVEVIADAMQSMVMVVHPDIDILASGFYIGNGIIVTAGHVADMNGIKSVIFEDGAEYSVLEQINHPDYDCGFLIIEDVNKPVLVFDSAEIQRGEEIFILGNPHGLTFISTKGIVCGRTSWDEWFGDSLLIVTDAAVYRGNSGSPLIDEDGEIRGVHVGWKTIQGIYGLNICSKDILRALEQAGLSPNG